MNVKLEASFGSAISLDLRGEYGEAVELQCFSFIAPPIEFRLVRDGKPLQEWQASSADIYDLLHCPGVREWSRDGHRFVNDLDHRHDVVTCGVLSNGLVMETRGLGLAFILLIWLREPTCRKVTR